MITAEEVRLQRALKRKQICSGGYYIVTGTFKGETTKWKFGASLELSVKSAERRKTRLEGIYPDETFMVEEVSKDNIDLPRNYA